MKDEGRGTAFPVSGFQFPVQCVLCKTRQRVARAANHDLWLSVSVRLANPRLLARVARPNHSTRTGFPLNRKTRRVARHDPKFPVSVSRLLPGATSQSDVPIGAKFFRGTGTALRAVAPTACYTALIAYRVRAVLRHRCAGRSAFASLQRDEQPAPRARAFCGVQGAAQASGASLYKEAMAAERRRGGAPPSLSCSLKRPCSCGAGLRARARPHEGACGLSPCAARCRASSRA